jgi:hypothetical protein
MPNVGKIVSGIAKAAGKKKAAAANKKGLKAAQGPSKAPKGYKPDTAGRADVKRISSEQGLYSRVMGEYVRLTPREAAKIVDAGRRSSMNSSRTLAEGKVSEATKNVISRSGRKANTPKLMKKAAKKAK